MEFLGHLAGIEYSPRRPSRREIEQVQILRERAENAAWRVRDEIVRLRIYYMDCLHRAERLQGRIGEESAWNRLARLAPVCTFFLAGFVFLNHADDTELVRFALASRAERRALILGETNADATLQAA
jgi:hypothetical protein